MQKANGTQIITNLDSPESNQYLSFEMGDMQIEIMNYERDRDKNGEFLSVPDENCNSLVTKVVAFGKVALLTADMDPWVRDGEEYGDSVRIVDKLVEELWNGEEFATPDVKDIEEYDDIKNYQIYNGKTMSTPEKGKWGNVPGTVKMLDETKVNSGKTISIDLLKLSHHAVDYNNTTYFLTSLNPKTAVVTGFMDIINNREKDCMPNAEIYATASDAAAIVATFSGDGLKITSEKLTSEWYEIDGTWYYFDANGRTFTDLDAHEIDGKIYYFDQKGAVRTENQWVTVNSKWRYWLTEGEYYKGDWLEENGEWYYLERNGDAAIGWKKLNGKWYYFSDDCVLLRDTWIGDYYVDETGAWDSEVKRDKWIQVGDRWWYCHADGSYTTSNWEMIDSKQYYFDDEGWMVTGWQWIDDKCYYFDESGVLATDTWIGNYYVDSSGEWVPSIMKGEWILVGDSWWYRYADGSYTQADWAMINGNWYYFDSAGWMVTGWINLEKEWYYCSDTGAMVANAWVGNYFLKSDGTMAREEWVENGKYYVDENGMYDPEGQIH